MKRILAVVVLVATLAMSVQAQESTPIPVDQTSVIGTGWDFVPQGEPGKVSIVGQTGPHSALGEVSVLIRNNSDQPISNIEVKSEFRDAAGKLVGVGDASSFEPNIVYPGEVAFGLTMGSRVDDPSMEIKLILTYDKGETVPLGQNLEFVYTDWTGDRILGELINPTNKPMEIIHLSYACFTGEGEFLGVAWGSAHGKLEPGQTTTFQIAEGDPNIATCERHLVTGNGF